MTTFESDAAARNNGDEISRVRLSAEAKRRDNRLGERKRREREEMVTRLSGWSVQDNKLAVSGASPSNTFKCANNDISICQLMRRLGANECLHVISLLPATLCRDGRGMASHALASQPH